MAFEYRRRPRYLATTFVIASLAFAGGALSGCGSDDPVVEGEVTDTGIVDETGAGDTSVGGDTATPDDTSTPDDTGTSPDTTVPGDTGGTADAAGDTGGAGGDTGGAGGDTGGGATDGGEDVTTADDTMATDSGEATDSSPADSAGPPTISIAGPAAVAEGNAGITAANFTVTLSHASSTAVTVQYATGDATATAAGGDYQANTGTLTFAPGETTQQVAVLVNGDLLDEPDETFSVTLTNPIGGSLGTATAQATITDDDATPSITIADETNTEGNTGNKAFTFVATLSAPSGQSVTVNYATAGGTATQGTDYQAATGTLTFAPGTTAQTVTVNVVGDTDIEADELFTVNLSGETNATLARASATGTIVNDDVATGAPTLSINDVSVSEGNTGTKTLTFTVTRSGSTAAAASVNWSTMDGTAISGGTIAVGGQDYVAQVNQTLNFAIGESSKTIVVTINGDTLVEPDQTFDVVLSNATGATITEAIGVGTITNDDALPTVSIGDFSTTEGNAALKAFTFTVTLSAAAGQNVTVQYKTEDGTATSGAGAGIDYIAIAAPLTLTFTPGETTKTVTVQVKGDLTAEPNETFKVLLSNAVGATIADGEGVGTITNDD